MEHIEHAAVTAHFLAGNRVELTVVDVITPDDPENGDAEFYRVRAILGVARMLKRADRSVEIT